MSSFLASVRVLCETNPEPGELATRLGVQVRRSAGLGRFVTGFVGRFEPASGRLDYVNAGHPPPCLVSGAGQWRIDRTGVPFGIPLETV